MIPMKQEAHLLNPMGSSLMFSKRVDYMHKKVSEFYD